MRAECMMHAMCGREVTVPVIAWALAYLPVKTQGAILYCKRANEMRQDMLREQNRSKRGERRVILK
jgi:hypothetical protein